MEHVIRVEHARVMLGGVEILHDLTWSVEKGARCFILGANGAGKTTLVKLLMGYVWPVFGAKVQVLGRTFGAVNLRELRRSIAWVSPFVHQWLGGERQWTGLEMALSGLDGTIGLFRTASDGEKRRAREILESLKAGHLSDRPVAAMSSGEQVKVLIARALMTSPELMILDEPSVYLDIAGRELLLRTIADMARLRPEVTMVFITQRIEDILPEFDCGMILKSGRIVASGGRGSVLTERNLRNAFDLDIRLIRTQAGRLWTVIE